MVEHVVEHDFIANSNARDVIRAVGLQRLLQGRLLALIAGFIHVYKVDRREDFNVGLGSLDRLQDERGLVALAAVESDTGRKL